MLEVLKGNVEKYKIKKDIKEHFKHEEKEKSNDNSIIFEDAARYADIELSVFKRYDRSLSVFVKCCLEKIYYEKTYDCMFISKMFCKNIINDCNIYMEFEWAEVFRIHTSRLRELSYHKNNQSEHIC